MTISYTTLEGKPKNELLSSIQLLYAEIFVKIDLEKFQKRCGTRELFTIMAWDGNQLIGFKMGYAIDATVFYSWIGGVKNDYRQKGIANELMNRQHEWCIQKGFHSIRTKTMNRWKSMLILNLKNGFNIIETYTDDKEELKIILEKKLVANS